MELNIFYKLAFLSLFSTAIFPFIIGVAGLSYGKHLFGSTLLGCIFAFIIFIVCGLIYESNSDVTLNDVTINAHYVDGYSRLIKKEGITNNELPYIQNVHGGFILLFGGEVYHGVIRYDYVTKKSYQINYSDYIKTK